jgi:hypothetical protein
MDVQTNRDRLVVMNISGDIAPAAMPSSVYRVGADGIPRVLPSVGGICLNVRVGDGAFAFAGDHIEPAVSMRHPDDHVNVGFCVLACVGNAATVLTGDAKGAKGVVTGIHGGIEHVMVDFDTSVMANMTYGDKIRLRAVGLGLELADAGDIRVFNCDPDFFDRLGCTWKDGSLSIGVAKIVPAAVMGSGLGRDTVSRGDYDIQTFDPEMVARYGLDGLRFGDIVAIQDADNTFGRIYRTGAVTIGIVAHGGSFVAGHGPGVTTLLTSSSGRIVPHIDAGANIAQLLKLR